MANRKRYDDNLLKALLTPIVKQWGRDEVLRALSEFSEVGNSERGYGNSTSEDRKRTPQKLSAVVIAERSEVPSEKRIILMKLATQFDHKSFLPTISDVRNFLEMRGQEAGSIKQRPDAFRKIIKAIVDMPNESLERLIRSGKHSGPSQLGPLSDAIKAASASVREHDINARKESESSGGDQMLPLPEPSVPSKLVADKESNESKSSSAEEPRTSSTDPSGKDQ